MSSVVTLTGTSTPTPLPNRAGGGVLVQTGGLNLQIDAGRATAMRLAAVDVRPADLDGVFLTHHHSDHLQGLDDLVFSRWIDMSLRGEAGAKIRLPVIAPDGPLADFLEHLLDPWREDIKVRKADMGREDGPEMNLTLFEASRALEPVWELGDVRVLATRVQHDPVIPSVGYRIESPDGVVAITGDTTVCDEVGLLAEGADVLVHEAMLSEAVIGTPRESIMHYHSDSVGIGETAKSAGVKSLMLTHMIPAPDAIENGVARYEAAVRSGGFTGSLVVGEDLDRVEYG
ncbi:MAG: MBL fold metallo-hydrolase [Chloroflexi bacterium]|nr:MBL fold metallo-hydrolase [Chloroflexota bacterium]MBT4072601.1 MBL fold metallo-hydrolase [Chloroflexota bacterium]MBT4515729.1 MBL fold metallo-hydrolase [Chloroflexota bacterium]MBT5318337.1 MBL fold metallo-hydrolase [Chloroflexota bacterium]